MSCAKHPQWVHDSGDCPLCAQENYKIPVDQDMKKNMNRIAQVIMTSLPHNYGFALFLFEFGEGGACTYISSGDREGVMEAVRAWLIIQDQERAGKN